MSRKLLDDLLGQEEGRSRHPRPRTLIKSNGLDTTHGTEDHEEACCQKLELSNVEVQRGRLRV
jgi:hypothetical protein